MVEEKLKNISDITTGLVLNRYESNVNSKLYKVLNLKSVENNYIDIDDFDTMEMTVNIDDKYILKQGDIVIKVAEPYTAAVVNFDLDNVVAPSNFIIIRTKEGINPNYVALYLNTEDILRQLSYVVEGSILRTIKISYLNNLIINFMDDKKKERSYINLIENLLKKRLLIKKQLQLEEIVTKYYLNNIN